MNEQQTYKGSSFFYVGWMGGTLICDDFVSPSHNSSPKEVRNQIGCIDV